MLRDRTHINARATWTHVAIAVLWLASTSVRAQDGALNDVGPALAAGGHNADLGAGETPASRAAIRKIIERETAKTNLPADIAEAVVFVESGYNPAPLAPSARSASCRFGPKRQRCSDFGEITQSSQSPTSTSTTAFSIWAAHGASQAGTFAAPWWNIEQVMTRSPWLRAPRSIVIAPAIVLSPWTRRMWEARPRPSQM